MITPQIYYASFIDSLNPLTFEAEINAQTLNNQSIFINNVYMYVCMLLIILHWIMHCVSKIEYLMYS